MVKGRIKERMQGRMKVEVKGRMKGWMHERMDERMHERMNKKIMFVEPVASRIPRGYLQESAKELFVYSKNN